MLSAATTDLPLGLTLDDVRAAADRIAPHIHRTPVMTSRSLDEYCGCEVVLKCENLQRAGAFKFRGALNAAAQLTDAERAAGIVTHSSGNHGQALAAAGKLFGVPVCVVMPETAPAVKRDATAAQGARIVGCAPTIAAREATVAREIASHGYTLIHPYDNWRVIAGQGTAALELWEQAGPFDAVVTPVGGGGLLAGTAIAIKGLSATCRVFGAEPAMADDARRSLESGEIQPSLDPKTIADGLRSSLGERPFSVIRLLVDGIATATEAEIIDALRRVLERVKIVIEPSSAVAPAVLANGGLDLRGRRVGVILSGGNIDLGPLIESLEARWLH
ncbi:MAG: threonine/serine dehydratase [Planctomycetota bacterium]|nr:threonine/serine dehydratase [Planctomycetota bacterium]